MTILKDGPSLHGVWHAHTSATRNKFEQVLLGWCRELDSDIAESCDDPARTITLLSSNKKISKDNELRLADLPYE
jgi:hypothetical protein